MEYLDFSQALEMLKNGIYMARRGWSGDVVQICIFKNDDPKELDYFECKSPEGFYQPWPKSDEDLLAGDWYQLEEQIK